MRTLRILIVMTAIGILITTCAKDKATDSGSAVPSGCAPGQEVWNVSDSLTGTLTFSVDANCEVTASGTLKTRDGDSIVFSNAPVSKTMEQFTFNASAQSYLVQTGSCTLRISGAAIEGAASGSSPLAFAVGSGSHAGTFKAVRTSGGGLTASAAMLAAATSIPVTQQANTPETYTLTSQELILTRAAYTDSFPHCYGDSLAWMVWNYSATEIYFNYQLSGNSLKLTDTTQWDTNSAIALSYHFTRQGNGSGIQGTWTCNSISYQVVSGTLDSTTRAELDYMTSQTDLFQLEFTATEIHEINTGSSTQNSSLADDFLTSWNITYYNIAATKISDNCVMLEGNTSGETVVIVLSYDYTAYYSSNSAHAQHIWYQRPTQCPNDDQPSWYYSFLSANPRSGIAAALKNSMEAPLPPPRRFPLLLQRH